MGVVTGVFQYTNGSPVANAAYQWKLSSDAIEFSSTAACVVPVIINGALDSSGNLSSTFVFNDLLSTTAGATTYYQLTVKAQNGGQVWNEYYYLTGTAANLNIIPPAGQPVIVTTPVGNILLQTNGVTNSVQTVENLVAGTAITLANSAGNTTINAVSTLPTAQDGDIIRWNLNGDNNWDAVNFGQQFSMVSPVWGGSPIAVGPMTTGLASLGTHNSINPTATAGVGDMYAASGASTNTVIGFITGQNGNNSINGMLAFYRYTLKIAIGNTSLVRYWMGLGSYTNTGTGGNATAILGTAVYASDTPNKTTLGFRYSAGTDTHWQAVAIVAGASVGSQTTVDTGIAPDTSPHFFEMTTNAAGTSVFYFIDRVLVATISTNLPNPATAANSWGDMFWTGDNKNNAPSISATQYYWNLSHK